MADWTIKQGTTRPILTDTLTYSDGSSPNLAGGTVTLIVRSLTASTPIINAAATITNTTNPATVSYTPTTTDTASFGEFVGSWMVTFSDGSTMAFPTVGYLDVVIEENLALSTIPLTIVSLAEAKDYLTIPATDRTHDNKLLSFIFGVTPVVEHIVGPVVVREFEEWYDGGSVGIQLRHQPVVTLVAVSEYRGPVEYPLVQIPNPQAGQVYSCMLDPEGRLVRRAPGGGVMPFPIGPDTVHVIYTAGRTVVPDNIRLGTLELVRVNYQQTQQGGRPEWGAPVGDEPDNLPGAPMLGFFVPNRVREMLNPNRRHPSVA